MSAGAWRRWSLWGATTGVSASLGRSSACWGRLLLWGEGEGVITRARKRSLLKGLRGERGLGETVEKKFKMDRFGSKYERGVRLRGGSAYRRSNKGGEG